MTNIISKRAQGVSPSATLAVSAKAAELRAQGIDVINLSAGEPDGTSPEAVGRAAVRGIKEAPHPLHTR